MTPPGDALPFEFATTRRIIFGSGVSKRLPEIAREFGSRALLVTGKSPERVRSIVESLCGAGIAVEVISIPFEPELAELSDHIYAWRPKACDFVIAIGGGSAIDAGKALAIMLNNPGELLDYLEVIGRGKPFPNASKPFIAVPTTAGTGAEVTRNAVIASAQHKVKASLRSPGMLPSVAVIDPDLARGLPADVAAATGLDALTQLIEPYVCSRANPFVDALCEDGIARVARSLKRSVQDPTPESRADMALAAMYSGMALTNAGLGAVHGLAGCIGGAFAAPHGAVCAALLPHVTAENLASLQAVGNTHAVQRYARVADIMSGGSRAQTVDCPALLAELVAELRIPSLASMGVRPEHVKWLAAQSLQASSMKANPFPLSQAQLESILRRALSS